MSPINFNNTSIQKQYQQYLIKLSSDLDIINLLIEKDNTIYKSIQIIKDAYFINGFIQINHNLIGSYNHNGDLKICGELKNKIKLLFKIFLIFYEFIYNLN